MRRKICHYNPDWDGKVAGLILGRNHDVLERVFGFKLVDLPEEEGDCQSWAFNQLGLPQLTTLPLTAVDLQEVGFQQVQYPQQQDLVVFNPYDMGGADHYGIFFEGNRIISRLGIGGPVFMHPINAFTQGQKPEFFSRRPAPKTFEQF